MGSKSWSSTTAIDNRLAVTDQAFGLSSSGSGNQTALSGPIINLNANSVGGAKSGAGNAGTISLNMLDGGAVSRSFDFAENSLSQMLASVLDGQKAQIAAANYQADTIGGALAQQAATSAAAQQATAAAQSANQDKLITWVTDNGKKLLIGGGLVGLAWWCLREGKGK